MEPSWKTKELDIAQKKFYSILEMSEDQTLNLMAPRYSTSLSLLIGAEDNWANFQDWAFPEKNIYQWRYMLKICHWKPEKNKWPVGSFNFMTQWHIFHDTTMDTQDSALFSHTFLNLITNNMMSSLFYTI